MLDQLPDTPEASPSGLELTIIAPNRAPLAPTPSLAAAHDHASTTIIRTPEEALVNDEIERTRVFCILSILVALLVAAVLPVVHGDENARRVVDVGLVGVVVRCGWTFATARRPGHRERGTMITAVVCAIAALTGVRFWGVFSPAPIILPFGIFFFGSHARSRNTLLIYVFVASVYAAMTLTFYVGHVRDPGIFRPPAGDPMALITAHLLTQFILLVSFVMARSSRHTALQSIQELHSTIRVAAKREALLNEAREDLVRALQVGGPGRFTEQTLGSFVLGNLIGRGAMGEVYEGTNIATGEAAAVKLLHRHLLQDPSAVARFVREAKVVSTLRTPHVVRVLEVSDEGAPLPYLAMERLRGEDLAEQLRVASRFELPRVVDLIGQLASGITFAHRAGVVHRDLKPQNTFLARRDGHPPEWKILDFGLSKLVDQAATATHGQIVGTPAYMAAEQARGEAVNARTDVYAMAAIAYRALTGRPPFSAPDVMTVLFDVVHKMPPRPGAFASIPEEVECVLAIGLAKDARERFPSAEELARAFTSAAEGRIAPEVRERARGLLRRQPWAG